MTDWAAAAAANNAAWCDLVARTHGSQTAFGADAWTSASRTPPLYPDAVTLGRKADGRDVLSRVDASPGCSVKDSFASLDLSEDGFHVLLDGLWIVHEEERGDPVPAGRTGVSWTRSRWPSSVFSRVVPSSGEQSSTGPPRSSASAISSRRGRPAIRGGGALLRPQRCFPDRPSSDGSPVTPWPRPSATDSSERAASGSGSGPSGHRIPASAGLSETAGARYVFPAADRGGICTRA